MRLEPAFLDVPWKAVLVVEGKAFAAPLVDVGHLAVLIDNGSRKTETKAENQEMFQHFPKFLAYIVSKRCETNERMIPVDRKRNFNH